ncbi:MAG TPA: hypothetical protein VL899_03970 [Alphaproteobacteria bacterium]|nr:hypothetical protein [Alphaproteobacteria bacterium]
MDWRLLTGRGVLTVVLPVAAGAALLALYAYLSTHPRPANSPAANFGLGPGWECHGAEVAEPVCFKTKQPDTH